jgi:predicted phage terminase large subunit-like protein
MIRLSEKQKQALSVLEDKETNELLFGGAAGGAKSFLGCFWILKMCLKYNGTRWLIGRSILKTLKETTIKTLFEVLSKQEIPSNLYKYNAQTNELIFYNKSEIIFKDLFSYPSDPNFDELGSLEITGCFIDEAVQVKEKAKNIVKSRIRYKLDEHGLVPKMLYTSNPGDGWLYDEIYKPYSKGCLPENKKFIQSLLSDNPYISKFYEDNLQTLDRESKERLLYGNWDYIRNGQKIKHEWISTFNLFDLEKRCINDDIDLVWNYTIDGAYTNDKNNDATGLLAFAIAYNNLYVRNAQAVRLEMPELLNYIPSFVSQNGYTNQSRIWIEPKASGLSIVQMLREKTNLNIISDKPPRASKEQRVDRCTPFIESRRLFILEHSLWADNYLHELSLFPNGTHDDLVDCTTMAIDKIEIRKDLEIFGFTTI